MKPLIALLLVAFIASGTVYSQEFNGKFLLSPTLSFNKGKTESKYQDDTKDTRKSTGVRIDVPVGWFITDNLAVGLSPGFSQANSKRIYDSTDEETKTKMSSFNLGLWARYYTSLSDRIFLHFTGQGEYGAGKTTQENPDMTRELKHSYYFIGLAPGLSYKASESIYIDATIGTLGYRSSTEKDEDADSELPEEKTNSFGFSFNSFSFGLTFMF